MNIGIFKNFLIDWDGVIGDVVWSHKVAIDHVLNHVLGAGLQHRLDHYFQIDVGSMNLNQYLEKLFEECAKHDIELHGTITDAKDAWKRYYSTADKIAPEIKGSLSALRLLKRFQPVIITSRSKEDMLRHQAKWEGLIEPDRIICPTAWLKAKPEPDTLIYAIDKFGFNPDQTVYIADAGNDYLAVEAANKTLPSKLTYLEVNSGWRGQPADTYEATRYKDLMEIVFNRTLT